MSSRSNMCLCICIYQRIYIYIDGRESHVSRSGNYAVAAVAVRFDAAVGNYAAPSPGIGFENLSMRPCRFFHGKDTLVARMRCAERRFGNSRPLPSLANSLLHVLPNYLMDLSGKPPICYRYFWQASILTENNEGLFSSTFNSDSHFQYNGRHYSGLSSTYYNIHLIMSKAIFKFIPMPIYCRMR